MPILFLSHSGSLQFEPKSQNHMSDHEAHRPYEKSIPPWPPAKGQVILIGGSSPQSWRKRIIRARTASRRVSRGTVVGTVPTKRIKPSRASHDIFRTNAAKKPEKSCL